MKKNSNYGLTTAILFALLLTRNLRDFVLYYYFGVIGLG